MPVHAVMGLDRGESGDDDISVQPSGEVERLARKRRGGGLGAVCNRFHRRIVLGPSQDNDRSGDDGRNGPDADE